MAPVRHTLGAACFARPWAVLASSPESSQDRPRPRYTKFKDGEKLLFSLANVVLFAGLVETKTG